MQSEDSNLDELVDQLKSEYKNKSSAMSPENSQSNSTDDLLNEVKSQFQQQSDANDHDVVADLKSQFKQKSQNNTAEDSSLKELKSQFQTSSQESNEDVFADLKSRYQHQQKTPSVPKSDPKTDQLLGSLKAQHQTQKTRQNEDNYQRNREEILKAEQHKQKKRKYLTQKAQTWLENLDPYSEEGFWFEEFAESYESRLDAAVDYLAVLEEDWD